MILTLQTRQHLVELGNAISSIGLMPLDAVVIKDRYSPILDHYTLFLGYDGQLPVFIANYPNGGVRVVPHEEVYRFSKTMYLSRPRRFVGTDAARKQALHRALNCINQKEYHFVFNNCEHFVNYVQTGKAYSQQTAIAGASTAAIGVAFLATKNPVAQAIGALAVGAGVTSLLMELFGGQSFKNK
jgi:hypothetical protein